MAAQLVGLTSSKSAQAWFYGGIGRGSKERLAGFIDVGQYLAAETGISMLFPMAI